MREGFFEVLIYIPKTKSNLNEKEINHVPYCIAIPNEEYMIKVNIYRDKNTKKFPMKYARIGLYIDTVDVNYWKRLDMSDVAQDVDVVTATFIGFKKSDNELKAFMFGNTVQDHISESNKSDTGDVTGVGSIRVDIFEAEVHENNTIFNNLSGCHEVPSSSRMKLNSEGTKFWQQPSVSTLSGRSLRNQEQFLPVVKWVNKPHPITKKITDPLHVLTLKYHNELVLQTVEDIYRDHQVELTEEEQNEEDTNEVNNLSNENENENEIFNKNHKRILYHSESNASEQVKKTMKVIDLSVNSDDEELNVNNENVMKQSIVKTSIHDEFVNITKEIPIVEIEIDDDGIHDRVLIHNEKRYINKIE